MKPFIFNFIKYDNVASDVDEKIVEYSDELNLNIISNTKVPAVDILNIRGETFTKAHQDPTDYQCNTIINKLKDRLREVTLTLSVEGTDKPEQLSLGNFIDFLRGRTITATMEPTDNFEIGPFLNMIGGLTHTREQVESTDIQ